MTRGGSNNRNINATSDEGTECNAVKHKDVSRTESEMYANNNAKASTYYDLLSPYGMMRCWMRGFKEELAKMNARKVGRPYKYTDSMVYWMLVVKSLLNMDYLATEGVIRAYISWAMVSKYGDYLPEGFVAPDCTTIFRRAERLIESISPSDLTDDTRVMCAFVKRKITDRDLVCAVDSTALNLTNTNLWRKTKWSVGPVYKGWIKVHALVDTDTDEIIAAIVTTDKMGDNTAFTMLTEMAFAKGHRISTIYADSAYESKGNWLDSEERGYTLVVKFKCNCNGKCNGSFARGAAAKEYLDMPYAEWRDKVMYGKRWKSECTFSDFKRLISEHIDAVTDKGIVTEVVAKLAAFNYFKRVRAEIVGVTRNGVAVA